MKQRGRLGGLVLDREGKLGIFLFVFAMLISYGAIRLGIGKTHDPGPGFFPFLAGVIIALLSMIMIMTSLRNRQKYVPPKTPFITIRASVTLGLFLLVGFLVEKAGFLVCVFFVTVVMLWLNGIKRWSFLLLVGLLASGGIYLVFNVLLEVRLPLGLLRF